MEPNKDTVFRKIKVSLAAAFSGEKLFTLGVAALALVVSIRSCYISQKSVELAEKNFSQERMITLKAAVNPKNDVFKIEPTDKNLILLKERAIYQNNLHLWLYTDIRLPLEQRFP